MKITIKEATAILRELKAGKHIQGIDKHGRGIGHIYYGDGYIQWSHAGSSANAATPRDMQFILEVIFKECVTWDFCHWSNYHIGYIPMNPQYTGIDYSRSHPNTFGV